MTYEQGQFLGQDFRPDQVASGNYFRGLPLVRDGSLVNFDDQSLRALFYLFQGKGASASKLAQEDVEKIAADVIAHPGKIQLGDFVDQIGLPDTVVSEIKARQNDLVPDERRPFFDRYARAVVTTRSIEEPLSLARLNPFTQFENQPPLLFGMGGGSKALSKGLPIDVLSMVLTAEKLRRDLGLGRCRIICANGITYTNIPNNPDFSKEGIDWVMSAERDLLQLAVERFGIADHWDIFLETDIEEIIGHDGKETYDRIVKDAEQTPFISGHHYALEMTQMYTLLNQETGGVKLGWFIRNINKAKPEYIMDEQPFDARYAMFLAYRGLTNTISIPYAHAGVRLHPGRGGVDKDAPYICYDPRDRILLSPFEDPEQKLIEATKAGGGLQNRTIRDHFGTIIKLFEEIVLGEDVLPAPAVESNEIFPGSRRQQRRARQQVREKRLNVASSQLVRRRKEIDDLLDEEGKRFALPRPPRTSTVGQRLQFILDYVFEGNRPEAEESYKAAFPSR